MNLYRTRTVPVLGGATSPMPVDPDMTCRCTLLAVPCVPRQSWNRTYETGEALTRGTIFPALDLPFSGKGSAR